MEIEILICDDDIVFAESEKESIQKAAERYGQEVWITFYQSGKELIVALEQKENTKLCIVLLDIDMPELNGYDVAKILNKEFHDILLLFVSSREDLVYEAFEYRPFRFIRKSHFELEIRHALRKAFEIMERRIEKHTLVKSNRGNILLAHSDILYLLMQNRKVCIYLREGKKRILGFAQNYSNAPADSKSYAKGNVYDLNEESCIEVRGTMKAMLAELDDKKLIQINSGCAVNCDYVESYTSDTIIMKNGQKLPISRNRAKGVKLQIERNWRK